MKAINRLDEIQKLSKYDKYLDKLADEVGKELSIQYNKKYYTDEFTCMYTSMYDGGGSLFITSLKFTTNCTKFGDDEEIEDDYKMACDFIINGVKNKVGGLTTELEYDKEIILDTYYDYIDSNESNIMKFSSSKS